MTLSQNRWVQVGEPAHEEEGRALDKIRELLSGDPLCVGWTNISIPDARDFPTEIDLLLLNGAGLFVIELKGWRGEIAGSGYNWRCRTGKNNWSPRSNPMTATHNKARRLASLLKELKSEQREVVQLPYVSSLVVMHGRNSSVGLDDRGKAHVYGLDTFGVAGVPAFSSFLREPPRSGQPKVDKPAVDAIRRLLARSGMTPQRVLPSDSAVSLDADALPAAADGAAGTIQVEAIERAGRGPEAPIDAPGLFDGLAENDLVRLGVPTDLLERVRTIVDEIDLIDMVSEDLFNDLDSVLAGADVAEVVSRRESLIAILDMVDAQAAAASPPGDAAAAADDSHVETHSGSDSSGTRFEQSAVEVPPVAPESSGVFTPADAGEMLAKLQSVFGDRVGRLPDRARRERKREVPPPALDIRRQNEADEVALDQPEVLVPSERLLDLARAETLQGRHSVARQLLDEVHSFMNRFGARDWSTSELDELQGRLRGGSLLAQRLLLLVDDLPESVPAAPTIEAGPAVPLGTLWTKGELGPPYSLLLRVPDVLDRVSGIYLSQLIGPERAAAVNARLLKGRPDGGRIRITPSGVVVSRRDADSPWFVVGSVEAHEWFPAERTAAA